MLGVTSAIRFPNCARELEPGDATMIPSWLCEPSEVPPTWQVLSPSCLVPVSKQQATRPNTASITAPWRTWNEVPLTRTGSVVQFQEPYRPEHLQWLP
ncbi:predicted protein [Lichtheimia corymbifera JMRC:FSU:9682]|uniref:Uncharacterized protein n=1 Tax=Lichtheimia corymbifera JMRC:FSU:9682 TaxID=1263082 RepID=A0A068S1A9_9FUNG|nr:predicted protein [Lichtheimia corymbifera JMRC:FSU:9682]